MTLQHRNNHQAFAFARKALQAAETWIEKSKKWKARMEEYEAAWDKKRAGQYVWYEGYYCKKTKRHIDHQVDNFDVKEILKELPRSPFFVFHEWETEESTC